MDKYEFKLKIDEMKALVSARNYNAAAEIAETISWRKIRNLNALVLAGEVFEQVGRYEESKEILLMAYDKSPIGRNIIYRLAEIAIKTQKFDEAQEYYDEFVDIAPHDNLKYVLKYKMTAAQGLPYKEQIKILEELKEQEYSEEWAYELAYLYHKDMQPEKCVEACDELILWFGDGIYVEKALELKMHYQPLSKQQEEKYRMFRQKRTGVIEVKPEDGTASGENKKITAGIPDAETNAGGYRTQNLREEIAEGMQQMQDAMEPYPQKAQMQDIPEMGYQQNLQQEPANEMSFEEIQAEWEKTKQVMQQALREAEGQEQEAAKERSLEEAEQLMQRLLGIIPLLEQKTAAAELDGQGMETAGGQPIQIQNDLEQAGRIVAGMNQILQDQIDSLIARERQEEQEPVVHMVPDPMVPDPTIELPHLPDEIIEGNENGATEKIEMEENALEKESVEVDNPVMSAYKEAVQPGISAIDLLQRVRMGKTAAVPQMQNESAAGMAEKVQAGATGASQLQRMQEETSKTESMQQMQALHPEPEAAPEVVPDRYEVPPMDFAEAGVGRNIQQKDADEEEEEAGYWSDPEGIESGYEEEQADSEYFVEEERIESEDLPENRKEQLERFEEESAQILEEDLSAVKEMNAEPEYEDGQENLVFAARPRFLTQAQLQAESAMDVKKDTQATKEFSKEAMEAARTSNSYENTAQTEGLDMNEMKVLTPEQRQIFSYFVPIAGMEAQIYDLISGVSEHLQYDKHALSGNIIIEGISGSGKTVLIMDIVKALQKEIKRPSGKTGKIDANALNQKDLDVLIEKISGGCLIIESAGKISRETAVKLSRCMEQDHSGTLYILEDTAEGIQKALERDSTFASKFTEKISIPLFSLDELVAFGKAYANDLDYDIDEMGVLALYKRIGNIQKLDHITTLTEVKEIVDEAIDNAEKGVLKKVFGILTATRANDDNYVILREKDFEE